MSDACKACTEAETNGYLGLIYAGCRGCEVRSVANAPRLVRERFYGTLPADKREAFIAEVNADFQRRKALVGAKA